MSDLQMSLLGEEENILAPKTEMKLEIGTRLDVAKVSFEEGQRLSWKELFSGYDTLHAITYSSGIHFVAQLVKLFAETEIVFGCEQVISYSLQEVMAYQTLLLERIRSVKSKEELIDKIENGSLRFFVARKKLSHEKIYLLSAKDGRKRVIMGSANMSAQAFGGVQRENISYMDGDEAYAWYYDIYKSLQEDATDAITAQALAVADGVEHMDELPISQTVKTKKILEIVPDKTMANEVEFALDVSNLSNKYKPLRPKADKAGKIVLSPSSIVTMRRCVKEGEDREREIRKEYPQLIIDVEKQSVWLNEEPVDLSPTREEIKNDVDLFLLYMDGYRAFHGDFRYLQKRYFEFANWFFVSSFMGTMRDMANRYNQNTLPYPIFGLIYGQSKAGKTSFLETLLKMMIGQKTRISAPEFTRKTIDGLRYEVKGAPIIVDDLTQTRFTQHAIETIKNDVFGISGKMVHYPAVVISANEDVKAVAPEIIRRTVICRVQAGLTNTEVMRSNVVRKVQKNVGTAFYREYLRRMLPLVMEMLEDIKDEDNDVAPDILKQSSEIICDIFKEFSDEELPEYFRELTLEDYFSEKVRGKHAMETIRSAWKTSKNHFVINKGINEIRYNAGQSYDADRIMKELPETLEARKSREWVVMNLREAESFFGITFKKTLMDKIRKQ